VFCLVNPDATIWDDRSIVAPIRRRARFVCRNARETDGMSDDLVRQLQRVRRVLAADVPGSPAWAATVEWRDELEAQIRSMGRDPDAAGSSQQPAPSRRPLRSGPRRIDRLVAGAR
jgi:hypothetical protein